MSLLERHRDRLRERLAERVLAEQPISVLDVGCGRGDLLQRIAATGVSVEGVEADAGLVAALRDRGLSVREGSAVELPHSDASFDWVVIRHVVHHLEEPDRAIREAFRVCRSGIVIAEPCYDAYLPGHAMALELERWANPQQRRLGLIHDAGWDAPRILAVIPEAIDVVVETCTPLAVGGPEDADEVYGRWTEGLDESDEQLSAYVDLRARVEACGFALAGSLMVIAKKAQ